MAKSNGLVVCAEAQPPRTPVAVALSLHALWKTRMAVENADKDARTTREYIIESVAYIREVYKIKPEQPEWLPMLDVLARFKKF